MLISEGITIHTTFTTKSPTSGREAFEFRYFPTEKIQSAVAVVDTKKGALVAVGGGRNYGPDREWNFAKDMITRSHQDQRLNH